MTGRTNTVSREIFPGRQLDTGRQLDANMTFRRRLLDILCTFNREFVTVNYNENSVIYCFRKSHLRTKDFSLMA